MSFLNIFFKETKQWVGHANMLLENINIYATSTSKIFQWDSKHNI